MELKFMSWSIGRTWKFKEELADIKNKPIDQVISWFRSYKRHLNFDLLIIYLAQSWYKYTKTILFFRLENSHKFLLLHSGILHTKNIYCNFLCWSGWFCLFFVQRLFCLLMTIRRFIPFICGFCRIEKFVAVKVLRKSTEFPNALYGRHIWSICHFQVDFIHVHMIGTRR